VARGGPRPADRAFGAHLAPGQVRSRRKVSDGMSVPRFKSVGERVRGDGDVIEVLAFPAVS
jgi:hypothetical protein